MGGALEGGTRRASRWLRAPVLGRENDRAGSRFVGLRGMRHGRVAIPTEGTKEVPAERNVPCEAILMCISYLVDESATL